MLSCVCNAEVSLIQQVIVSVCLTLRSLYTRIQNSLNTDVPKVSNKDNVLYECCSVSLNIIGLAPSFLFCFRDPSVFMNPFIGPKLYKRYVLNQTDQKCSFLGLFSVLKFKHNFTPTRTMEILCHGHPHYFVWRSYGRRVP